MYWAFLIGYIGFHLAPWLFNKTDILKAQNIWIFAWVAWMLSVSMWKGVSLRVKNPYACLFLGWVTLQTLVTSYNQAVTGNLTFQNFFQFFNILCIFIFYLLISSTFTGEAVSKGLEVFRWAVIVTLFVGTLQAFGLGQFFYLIYKKHWLASFFNNPVSGFIGQPTILATFLGASIPLFLKNRTRENYLCIAFILVILAFFTGTQKGDIATSGIIVALVSSVAFAFFEKKSLLKWIIPSVLLVSACAFIVCLWYRHSLWENNGRIQLWTYYFTEHLPKYSVTGAGLGYIESIRLTTPSKIANHVHLEVFQIWIELGVIGVILFFGLVKDFFELPLKSAEASVCKSVVLGILVGSLLNPIFHFWYVGLLGLCCYSFTYALNNEEI